MNGPRARVAVVAAAAALVAVAPSGAATSSRSNPKGVALLARVHHAYANVPGVSITGTVGILVARYSVALRSGTVVAEEFVGKQPSGTTTLVAHGEPTFVYDAAHSCWTALARSAPQTLENIGVRFPDQPGMTLGAPVRTATGWSLPVVAEGTPGTFEIDGKTLRVREITLNASGAHVVEHVSELSSAPKLPDPSPRC